MSSSAPTVQKPPSGVLQLGVVDITPLEAILSQLTESVWCEEDSRKPNKFACFHSTRHVIFRFCDFQDVRIFESRPAWKIWSQPLLSVMNQAIAGYSFDNPVYPKAMFASLSASRRIDSHIDGGKSARCAHKIHIPVCTEPDAILTVNGVKYHLQPGYAYEVNNRLVHGAFNGGTHNRIHFIFEVYNGN